MIESIKNTWDVTLLMNSRYSSDHGLSWLKNNNPEEAAVEVEMAGTRALAIIKQEWNK